MIYASQMEGNEQAPTFVNIYIHNKLQIRGIFQPHQIQSFVHGHLWDWPSTIVHFLESCLNLLSA